MIRSLGIVAVIAWLAAGGCYDVSETPERTVLHFGSTVKVLLVVVPALVVLAGLVNLIRSSSRGRAIVYLFIVVTLTVLLVPGIYNDEVVVSDKGVWQRTGFWFVPNTKGFNYDGVLFVELIQVEKRSRRGKRMENAWVIHNRDNTHPQIDPGDLWDNNEALILQKIKGYGVKVVDSR